MRNPPASQKGSAVAAGVPTAFQLLFHHYPSPMWVYDAEAPAFFGVNHRAVQRDGYARTQHSGLWRHRLKNGTIIQAEISSHTDRTFLKLLSDQIRLPERQQ